MAVEDMQDTQFQPGQSGNPKGVPKGPRLATLFKKALEMQVDAQDPETGLPRKMTLAEATVLATIKQATKGNTKAMNIILDRTEGKVLQPIGGPDGIPLAPPIIQIIGKSAEKKD